MLFRSTGSEILGEIHCGNLGKILDMLPRISFRLSPKCHRSEERRVGKECRSRWESIPVRFWPPGFFFPAGISLGNENPGGQNLAGILPRILPRFSPGSNNPGGQNLAGMLPRISPRFSPRSKFTVAKILARSCLESRQDW